MYAVVVWGYIILLCFMTTLFFVLVHNLYVLQLWVLDILNKRLTTLVTHVGSDVPQCLRQCQCASLQHTLNVVWVVNLHLMCW